MIEFFFKALFLLLSNYKKLNLKKKGDLNWKKVMKIKKILMKMK